MDLVIDANILVGHLLREKGQQLLANNQFVLFISVKVFQETLYEFEKRLESTLGKGHISQKDLKTKRKTALKIFHEITTVLPLKIYSSYEKEAKIRMHKDIDD